MSYFKIGDVVVCIHKDSAPELTVGKRYTITDIDEGFVFLANEELWYGVSRFAKIAQCIGDLVSCVNVVGAETLLVHDNVYVVEDVFVGGQFKIKNRWFSASRFVVMEKKEDMFKIGTVVVRKAGVKSGPERGTVLVSSGPWLRLELPNGDQLGGIHFGNYQVEAQPHVFNEKAKPMPSVPKPRTPRKTPADKFFVYKVGGGSPKVLHTSYQDAKNEANRLAGAWPGHEFVVLTVTYSVKRAAVYKTEAKEYKA